MRYLAEVKEVLRKIDIPDREADLIQLCWAKDAKTPTATNRVDLGAPRILDLIVAITAADAKFTSVQGPYLVTDVQGVSVDYRVQPRFVRGIWMFETVLPCCVLAPQPQIRLWTRYDNWAGHLRPTDEAEIYILRAPINRVTISSVASLELRALNRQLNSCARCGLLLKERRVCAVCE